MELPASLEDWRHLRITIQAAGPIEALAESLADICGAASTYPITAYWDTELDEIGVTSQETGRVEVICDPVRAILGLDRVTEWANEFGVSTFLVEIQPTYPFLYLKRGD